MTTDGKTSKSNEATARGALERVCSGQCLEESAKYYSPHFVDHVNGAHLQGYAGIERSVAAYKRLLTNLNIKVNDQVTEGGRVACRFAVTGELLGRKIEIDGITISRFENGLVVEDWSVTDTMSVLRQAGWWRAAWALMRGG